MGDAAPIPNAGVTFPPPLLYVAGVLAGLAFHHWWPWPITAGSSTLRFFGAVACVVGWFVIFLSAFLTFRRAHTSLIPNRPATAFVETGPYRFTRNPMYVSMAVLYLGATLATNSWWPIVLLPVVLLVVDRRVIAREERYLASAFPVEYPAYTARVRRWL